VKGYCGVILKVDLTTGTVEENPLRPEAARAYVGGSGLAAHLFFETVAPAIEAGASSPERPPAPAPDPSRPGGLPENDPARFGHPDPLGPDNPLIVATGPLTGTRLPCASRWTVAARSPLTGIWGEANVGGFFGAELKAAGYDALVVTGRAERPVYLLIEGGRPARVSLEPADGLWSLDTYAIHDALLERHADGGRRPRVMAIGPAGENLVRFAAVVHDKHHVAGRTGLGAVMGSKRLKAVVVRGAAGQGEDAAFRPADPEAVRELAASFVARAKEQMVIRSLGEAGTIMGMDFGALIGDVPIRNWSRGAWDRFDRVGVGAYAEVLTGTGTCHACPVACKRKVTTEALGRRLENAPGAEYETLGCLGPNLLIADLPAVLVAGELSNRLGLDTISAGGTLGFAYEAADRGLLDGVLEPGEADRLRDAWGDAERLVALLEDIAHRRGVGDALAEGSARLAARAGAAGHPEALDLLSTVKGLEAPAHDPRAAHGMAVAYATSLRGACHMNGLMYGLEHAGFAAPEVGAVPAELQQSSEGKGRLQKVAQDLGAVFGQSAVICQLGGNMYNADDLLAMLNAVTGFGYTLEELMECGERIVVLKRGLGNLYGLGAADDRLPARLREVFDEGGAAGSVPDLEGMLAEWREARSLDERGVPRREVLERVGLGRLADLLHAGC